MLANLFKILFMMPNSVMAFFKAITAILSGLFLADFITGVFHWFEDRYGNPNWKLFGNTIRANQEHHRRPRAFLEGTFLHRNAQVFLIGMVFLAGFWALGWLNLFTASAVVFGSFANEIHRFTHRSPKENGRIITAIQKTGLLQSFQHHAQHHRKAKDTHFCVMTNYLNPILERVQFFQRIEAVVHKVGKIRPRFDDSVNAKYQPHFHMDKLAA